MRKVWVLTLAAALLLTFAAGANAAPTMDDLAGQVKQLQDSLKQAMDRIQKLEAEKAAAPAAAAAKPAAPAATPWYDKLAISGYWHARYEDRTSRFPANTPPGTFNPATAVKNNDDFLIRRMYLGITGKPNDRTTGVIMLRRLGNINANAIDLEALFVNYAISPLYNVEFGRVYNKFGWDAWESSSKRLPFDRFAGAEGYTAGGVRGLYFAGPTDQGVYFSRKSDGEWTPTVYVGLVNSNFITNPDNNSNKAVSLDLKWKRDVVQFGASYIGGDYTEMVGNPAVRMTTLREMFGLFVHTDPNPWGFQGEYLQGRLFGQEVKGFYGQVARKLGGGTGYVRYEQYDPSLDVDGDLFDAWKFGYAWQMDKNNELTFEYMTAERGAVPVGQWGFQWQLAM